MTSDIRLAFAHPSERSEATSDALRDRISLRDHIREVEIGAFQAERGVTQRLCFNIVVEVRLPDGLDDDVDRILSYDTITEAIDRELSAERLNLLETLAERVGEAILLDPRAARVFVRIEKLDRGPGALGVEIVRDREQINTQQIEEIAPHPVVVYLDNAAIASQGIAAMINRLEALGPAIVLTVGLPNNAPAQTGHRAAQRRIDLLAIEQNAWVLAARDPRCVVVATRTELDWAMKQGQISVWAPSKIILDATDPPPFGATDPATLTRWFAEQFDAQTCFAIAEAPVADLRRFGPQDALDIATA